jgi:RNA-binding protein YlmH
LIVLREISPFILANLNSAGKAKLKLTAIDQSRLRVPEPEFKLIKDTVASLRLDNIVSAGFSISREKASDAIRAGKVAINHLECTKTDKPADKGDRISLRGMGKIEFCEAGNLTRKGRTVVTIRKYL